ncbi:MAG TPA: uracil phosphoribosyltransferase [Candidatus Babeliales bacterium]|nr:uracil phosphoribosyltransferase [Candidatus Babeliales bacterium]
MNITIKLFLTILRNKNTDLKTFRKAAYNLSQVLAQQALQVCKTEPTTVETPIAPVAQGLIRKQRTILVPILRSGITMLPAFLDYFETAVIAVVGLKRDEVTAQAHLYYSNIPILSSDDQIIILDPMIATGGTAIATIQLLQSKGITAKQIIFVAMVGAPQGMIAIKQEFPDLTLLVAGHDEGLTKDKFIIPGLGDFGDRFFGTLDE